MSHKVKMQENMKKYTPDAGKLTEINDYIRDVMAKSGTGITADNLKNSLFYEGNPSAVANVIKKAMRGEKITLVAFGGSITNCAGHNVEADLINHGFTEPKCYVKLVGEWFKELFGNDMAEIFNAGIGATDTPYSIHRMNMDVMSFNPDLVIVEWDKNDKKDDPHKQATYENMLRKLIRNNIAVVMLGMCGKNANGDDSSMASHESLAKHYNLPYISYRDAFGERENNYKSELLTRLTKDGVHPNIVGHRLIALILNNYFGNIYKNIEHIGTSVPQLPAEPYNPEAVLYGEGRVADLDDIAEGRVKGIKMFSLGSFEKDTQLYYNRPNEDIRDNHRRYGYKAGYKESYEPMVLEIEDCYSLHLLLMRASGMSDGRFKVFVNGEEVLDPKGSFTSGTSGDNTQIENAYCWASSLVCLNSPSEKITLEILPVNTQTNNYVGLYSLLLCDAPSI